MERTIALRIWGQIFSRAIIPPQEESRLRGEEDETQKTGCRYLPTTSEGWRVRYEGREDGGRESKRRESPAEGEGGEDTVARGTIEVRRTARRRRHCAPHPNAVTPLIIVAGALSSPP